MSNDLGWTSSRSISWLFSSRSVSKCGLTPSAFSMQEIMNGHCYQLIGLIRQAPALISPLTNQSAGSLKRYKHKWHDVMKLCSLKQCDRATASATISRPNGALSDITSSASLNSLKLINKQFSVAFHQCHLSLRNANACQKLA